MYFLLFLQIYYYPCTETKTVNTKMTICFVLFEIQTEQMKVLSYSTTWIMQYNTGPEQNFKKDLLKQNIQYSKTGYEIIM